MRQIYLLVYGTRILTEVIAESQEEAYQKAFSDTAITIGSICQGLAPYEYRSYLSRSTVKILPLNSVEA